MTRLNASGLSSETFRWPESEFWIHLPLLRVQCAQLKCVAEALTSVQGMTIARQVRKPTSHGFLCSSRSGQPRSGGVAYHQAMELFNKGWLRKLGT